MKATIIMHGLLLSAAVLFCPSEAQQREPSFAPTVTFFPTPTDGVCDDDKVRRFRTTPTQTEPCVWLAARVEEQPKFCQPGMEAYDLCEETCLKCRDPCRDTLQEFVADGFIRDCEWLTLRVSVQERVCLPNHAAYFACPETCNVCDGFPLQTTAPPAISAPTTAPIQMSPAPIPKSPAAFTPTTGCDDSATARFFVEETNKEEPCVWLASRPEAQRVYCAEGHSSGARLLCEETCGACGDDCKDYNLRFSVNGVLRDCTWLGLRPEMMAMLCQTGGSADFICPETCNICDSDDNILTPTQAPTVGFCDDDKIETFFVAETVRFERCVWLEARPDAQVTYCQQDHPSGAYDLCEETCGKCSDDCEDSDEKYLIDSKIRTCKWLSLRLEDQKTQCVPGKDAYELCGETCDVCDTGTRNPASVATPSPNQAPTPASTPAPTHPPGICDDDKSANFFVLETNKLEGCVYLESRETARATYCRLDHPSGALDMCAETCGKCSDNCADSDGKFQIEGEIRTCLWLKLRPNMQPVQCTPGTEAYLLCGETCDVCDTTIAK